MMSVLTYNDFRINTLKTSASTEAGSSNSLESLLIRSKRKKTYPKACIYLKEVFLVVQILYKLIYNTQIHFAVLSHHLKLDSTAKQFFTFMPGHYLSRRAWKSDAQQSKTSSAVIPLYHVPTAFTWRKIIPTSANYLLLVLIVYLQTNNLIHSPGHAWS